MANEGSTKPTYSELAFWKQKACADNNELERVRRLLQRMYELVRDGVLVRNVDEDDVFGSYVKQVFRLTATLREVEIVLTETPQATPKGGAEAAQEFCPVCNKRRCWDDKEESQGAESADIGKLDRVDKKADV